MFENISGWRLGAGIYIAGYFVYLIPAIVWGWNQDLVSYVGFVLWQGFLYAPFWPFVLSAQVFAFIAPLLIGA